MAKFLFVCKPTTITEYIESLIQDDNRYNLQEILSVVFGQAVFKKYKNEIVQALRDKGFFSKDDIDKATAVKLGNKFMILSKNAIDPHYVAVHDIENLTSYDVQNLLERDGQIVCLVNEDSLPEAFKAKVKSARAASELAAQKKKERAERKEAKAKLKEIERAKQVLREAGLE